MTEIYLLRHAQPDPGPWEDRERPLTEKGLRDLPKVTRYFADRHIDAVYASPYRRALQTITPFAEAYGFPIHIVEDFREVNLGTETPADFLGMIHDLWCRPETCPVGGESYGNVERRTVAALQPLLKKHRDQTVVVAMHSTAMSRMIHYYDPSFGWEEYLHLLHFTPYAARLLFDGTACREITFHDFEND